MYDRTVTLDHTLPLHIMSSSSTFDDPTYAMKVEPITGGNVLS